MLIVGGREAEQGTVSVRDRIEGDLGAMPLPEVIAKLLEEVRGRMIRQTFSANAGLGDRHAENVY